MMAMLLLVTVFLCCFLEYCTISAEATASVCKDGDVRLTGGRHYREGRVEVCRNQHWGRVCDDEWDERESTVVCRQLQVGLSNAQDIRDFVDSEETGFLPFVLDDLGCTGSEINLLKCLPQHNCGTSTDESAVMSCSRIGVSLEFGPKSFKNNTLISTDDIGEGQEALFCSTDRSLCCNNSIDGSWYFPNGSMITNQQIIDSNHTLYVTWGNQTVGLNYRNSKNFNSLPVGIYHCEMMDKSYTVNHLYVGIYPQNEGNIRITSLKYDRSNQTIMCTSTGGPATNIRWTKDNIRVEANGELYEESQTITNTTDGTYESRLTIINKSSTTAGYYTCEVSNSRGSMNMSLYVKVCKDKEIRFSNDSNGDIINVEVCADDRWYVAVVSAVTAVDSQEEQSISLRVQGVTSTSVTITWSLNSLQFRSSVPNNESTSITCKTVFHQASHEVKHFANDTTTVRITGLIPDMTYDCCVNVHGAKSLINLPFSQIVSGCVITKTLPSDPCNHSGMIGFSSFSIFLLFVCAILIAFILKQHYTKPKPPKVSAGGLGSVEHFVGNPIYNDFPEGNNANSVVTTDGQKHENITHATYEQISVLPVGHSGSNDKDRLTERHPQTMAPLVLHMRDDIVAEVCKSNEDCPCSMCNHTYIDKKQ